MRPCPRLCPYYRQHPHPELPARFCMGRRSGGLPVALHLQRISIWAFAIFANQDPLKTERKLGPYSLPPNDPDYPIDYILDGQQRATSIFGVFQSALRPDAGEDESIL